MAYTLTTSSSSALLWSYFHRKMLDFVKPRLVFDQIGDKKPLPQKYGNSVIFTKFKKLTPITASGTEGTPPTPLALTSAQITTSVGQYKNAVGYTDALIAQGSVEDMDSFIEEVVSENAGTSLDSVCRNALEGAIGTTIFGGNAAALSDVDAADKLTLSLARQAKVTLESNDVGPHSSGNYIFVGHPNTIYDMKTDTATGGWIDVFKYSDAGNKNLFNAEAGMVDDIKFLSSTLVSKTNTGTSAGAYVYSNMIFGYQPFASVKLDGYSLKLIHHKPGSSGVSDCTDELGTVAWKIWYAAKYLGGNATVADPERAILVRTGRST